MNAPRFSEDSWSQPRTCGARVQTAIANSFAEVDAASAALEKAPSEWPPMSSPHYPSLYQINTRVWLTELSQGLGRRATLDDIRDAELDHLAEIGFDWVWLLSVWQTGAAAQRVSRTNPEWRS